MRPNRAAWVSVLLVVSSACGATPTRPRPPLEGETAQGSRPEIVQIWSRPGAADLVWDAGIGERTVFVSMGRRLEGGGHEHSLYAIDRQSGQERVLATQGNLELIRVDPLIVNHWDGERQRWLGRYVVGLSDALEPRWQSGRMSFGTPRNRNGPLVLVDQSQVAEYVGLDPDDGSVAFRIRSPGDDEVFGDAAEAETFVVTPLEDRAILTDLSTGEVSGVVDAELGAWEIVGDRLVASVGDRLVAYDGRGREVWSHAGVGLAGRTRRSWTPDDPLVRPSRVFGWQQGRGLVAFDAAGEERWVHDAPNEEDWGFVVQQGSHVVVSRGERTTLALDAESGEVAYACRTADCDILRVLDDSVLVETTRADGSLRLTLYGRDGQAGWTHEPEVVRNERGEVRVPSIAFATDYVAMCSRGGPVRFLARTDGHVLSELPLPAMPTPDVADPESEADPPSCSLRARDNLVLASNGVGVALFAPAESRPSTPPSEVLESTLTTLPAPEPRPFYVLSTLVPPAQGAPLEAYTRGRALYQQAREAFGQQRFADASAHLLEAYRAFFTSRDGEIQRIGLECCYDVRVSLDHAVDEALTESVVTSLTSDDDRCFGIIMRAPEPSVPF